MMTINNQISVIGNLGLEPEERGKTKEGHPVVCFAIAQSMSSINPVTRERVEREAQWFRVSCFSSLAIRAISNLKKGDLVLVTGELKSNTYTTQKGETRAGYEILAGDVLKVQRLRLPNQKVSTPQIDEAVSGPNFDDWTPEVTSS